MEKSAERKRAPLKIVDFGSILPESKKKSKKRKKKRKPSKTILNATKKPKKKKKKVSRMYYRKNYSNFKIGGYSHEVNVCSTPVLLSKVLNKSRLQIDEFDDLLYRKNKNVSFFNLPNEVLFEILTFCTYPTVFRVFSLVSKRFYMLVGSIQIHTFMAEKYGINKIKTVPFPKSILSQEKFKILRRLRYIEVHRKELHFFLLDDKKIENSTLFIPRKLKKDFVILSNGSVCVYAGRDRKTLDLTSKNLFDIVDASNLRQFVKKVKKSTQTRQKKTDFMLDCVSRISKNQFKIGFKMKSNNRICHIYDSKDGLDRVESARKSFHKCTLLFDVGDMSVSLLARGKVRMC